MDSAGMLRDKMFREKYIHKENPKDTQNVSRMHFCPSIECTLNQMTMTCSATHLSASRRTIQQNPSGQRQSQRFEPFRMSNRLQHAQRQLLANAGERANVAPRHVRDRGETLAFRGWLDVRQGGEEVVHGDMQGL